MAIRIGLLRHFPVTREWPRGWVTAHDLTTWRAEYDQAAVIPGPVDTGGIAWQKCYSSDLPRALRTAEAAHPGEIEIMPFLREPEFAEFGTGRLRLPLLGWRWLLRLAWMTGHRSQAAAKAECLRRVHHLATTLFTDVREDTLIVGHAGMMVFLRRELLKLGYAGPNFRIPAHARVYVFERQN